MGKQKGANKKGGSDVPIDQNEEEEEDLDLGANKKKSTRYALLDVEEDVDTLQSDKEESLKSDTEVDKNEPEKKGKGKKSKKEKRKKKDEDDEELDAMLAELALEIEGKKPTEKESKQKESKVASTDTTLTETQKVDTASGDAAPLENELEKSKSKKKKKKGIEKQVNGTQAKETVKQNEIQKNATVKNSETTEPVPSCSQEINHGEEEMDVEEKTSKKKKGKKDKDVKETKKGPGKKQIALMQELLRNKKEEEERLKREEEERIRREEEAEIQRQEQLRLEKERKEKKKLKEKEKKERLKKEGKLLTAKQKAEKKRAQASLQIARETGQFILGKDLKKQDSNEDRNSLEKEMKQKKKETQGEGKIQNEIEKIVSDQDADDDVVDDWEQLSESDEDFENKPPKSKRIATKEEKVNSLNSEKVEIMRPLYRSPIVCVLGHVDTGKTKLLDFVRKTHVQDNEAGGITQQIGATFVPPDAIKQQCQGVKVTLDLTLPGLLIIDTPGHESFTNLRSRGSSLCDIAILVIDIMHGLEPQTIESINLLKSRKTPFIVSLNKIDRLYDWRSNPRRDVEDLIKSQQQNTKFEFEDRVKNVILQLAEQSLNAALFYENKDPRSFVSLVPTSAATGDGMGNLISLLVNLTQNMMLKKMLYDFENLEATVLEVKAIPGLGTTIDVILVNGKLSEGDKIVLAGHDGPFATQIRSLLVPQPLRELRVKTPYQELKTVYGAMGVKVAGHDLDKAIAGLQLYVAKNEAEVESFKDICWKQFGDAMKTIKCIDKGVYVQASTLGSLEALLEFLKVSKIPYSGVRIGPVVKRDVVKISTMLESSPDFAVILAFDVKIERDAQELADQLGVKIFQAEIIYHLFDKFTQYREDLKRQRREQYKSKAVFPCKLRILPNCIFNARDPIVVGVSVEDGIVVPGTPIAVPSKGMSQIEKLSFKSQFVNLLSSR